MERINKRLLISLVLLILFNSWTVAFAATDDDSYEAGYDEGYDYAYEEGDKVTSGRIAYNRFIETRHYRTIERTIKDFDQGEFRDGFLDGFNDAYDSEIDQDHDVDYAETLGESLGKIYGSKDFQDGENSNWRDALPSRREVRNMFDLDRQNASYRNAFITEFNDAFQEGYIDAYDTAMFEPIRITLEQGFKDGEDIGAILGAAFGLKDYYEGRGIDFERNLPSDREIRSDYSLRNDSREYEDGFIAGFISAFEETYNEAYREANLSYALQKITSEIIPKAGGSVESADGSLLVNILPGTFYHDINLTITTSFDAKNRGYGNLIKSSDSQTIKLVNSSGNVDDSKLIELAFEYYGDKLKGGIYRQSSSGWLYIPTEIKDGVMTAEVKPSTLTSSGTTFSAFVDTDAIIFPDARGHWAKDEINTYLRRGIIYGYEDMTFKPDNNISRAEFLTLLSRVYNWNTSMYLQGKLSFTDSDSFGYFANIIDYATYFGYIYGYPDGSFKANNPISYAEVEIIMNRVIWYGNFRWLNTANKMLYEKKVSSKSFEGMDNYISRGEVAYMLYNLTE